MFIFLPFAIELSHMPFRFIKQRTNRNLLRNKEVKPLNSFLSVHILKLKSSFLDRKVKVRIYLPSGEGFKGTLILNDGQDMEQLRLVETLSGLMKYEEFPPVAVVAIHANEDRMQEYGIAGFPDFKNRGKRAWRHSNFISKELVPFLQKEYGLMQPDQQKVLAGFSMGGLSALDICWHNPGIFNKTGVFSGSLWWRSKNTRTPADDDSRIMHRLIRKSDKREGLKFWFQTGTEDEAGDRNKNGVIDSIDDTVDLINELKDLGYGEEEIVYEEIQEGKHNFNTWSRVFPDFLRWAFVE